MLIVVVLLLLLSQQQPSQLPSCEVIQVHEFKVNYNLREASCACVTLVIFLFLQNWLNGPAPIVGIANIPNADLDGDLLSDQVDANMPNGESELRLIATK